MRYNTMFDVAFTVNHDCEEPRDVPVGVLIDALQQRVRYLKQNPDDAAEAFGVCDTYDREEV
jgi:hypothetical protein